jgi:thioredoxin-related protein
MKNLLIIGLVIFGIYLSVKREGGKEAMSRFVISEATSVRTVSADQRIRVILFTGTEWCPACTQLESSVIATPAWQEFARGELDFQKVDVPVDRSRVTEADRALISRYGVRGYPTMVVVDRGGKELSRQVGSGPPVENYKDWIRRHSAYY